MAPSVCIFGDSVAKGIVFDAVKEKYLLLKNRFSNLIGARDGIRIKNYSHFGCTVKQGKTSIEKHLAELSHYDAVILEYGGNDCDLSWEQVAANPKSTHLPKTPLTEFSETYRQLISEIKESGGTPVLMTLPPIYAPRYFSWISRNLDAQAIMNYLGDVEFIYRWHEMYNLAVCRIALEQHLSLIDISSAFLQKENYQDLLCADGIHPNEKGHQLIADEIDQQLNMPNAHGFHSSQLAFS